MSAGIAISLGDPRGIGPEVTEAAVRAFSAQHSGVPLHVFGPSSARLPPLDGVTFHAVAPFDGSEASAGAVSLRSVEEATRLCLDGDAVALVTAPIHKPALRAAGAEFPGHTELLRSLTGAGPVGMLMNAERTRIGGSLRVLLATVHIPLADVARTLTTQLLVEQTGLLAKELRERWGIADPSIALCALNPHASDRGLFGDEERQVYAPAVDRLRRHGIRVNGPIPADSVFRRTLGGEFDAVVAPYHDVAMAAFKTVSFGSGVNVTLGLPFVRTSPDHGTALDIAGRGEADPSSMTEALRLALRLSGSHLSRRSLTDPGPASGPSVPPPP